MKYLFIVLIFIGCNGSLTNVNHINSGDLVIHKLTNDTLIVVNEDFGMLSEIQCRNKNYQENVYNVNELRKVN